MARRREQASEKSTTSKAGQTARSDALPDADDDTAMAALVRRHLRFGWRALLLFVVLGLLLETLHGFKIGWYVDAANTTRRHMWTLAHAHGTLLAVLNLIFAATIRSLSDWSRRGTALTSSCLRSAAILLPAGFFLGGCFTHDGDPGIGIVLVPVGGILLIIAVLVAARG